MTEYEFEQIKIRTVVSNRSNSQEMFEIFDLDVFGRDSKVHMGIQLNVDNPRYMRLDTANCKFWDIVGRMV